MGRPTDGEAAVTGRTPGLDGVSKPPTYTKEPRLQQDLHGAGGLVS